MLAPVSSLQADLHFSMLPTTAAVVAVQAVPCQGVHGQLYEAAEGEEVGDPFLGCKNLQPQSELSSGGMPAISILLLHLDSVITLLHRRLTIAQRCRRFSDAVHHLSAQLPIVSSGNAS